METRRDPGSVPGGAGVGLLTSPVRRSLVDLLASLRGEERTRGLTVVELGERLGLHPTTIRFHVDQLVAVKVLGAHFVRSGTRGRPSKRYVIREVPLGESAAEGPDQAPFALLAGVLASALSGQEVDRLTPEEAGARWARARVEDRGEVLGVAGPAERTVTTVVDLLGEWGFSREVATAEDGAVEVTLRECPFVGLASHHPDVVCGLHRGLLRGALDALDEHDAEVQLRPFVTPTSCAARIVLGDAPVAPADAPTPVDEG